VIPQEEWLDERLIDMMEALVASDWGQTNVQNIPAKEADKFKVAHAEIRKIMSHLRLGTRDPDSVLSITQYREFAEEFLKELPKQIADILIQVEHTFDDHLGEDFINLFSGTCPTPPGLTLIPLSSEISSVIWDHLPDINYPQKDVPAIVLALMHKRKILLEAEQKQLGKSLQLEIEVFGMMGLETIGLGTNASDMADAVLDRHDIRSIFKESNNPQNNWNNANGGARVNPYTGSSVGLSKSGKKRYVSTITPPILATTESAQEDGYKGERPQIATSYSQREEADRDIRGILSHLNVLKTIYSKNLLTNLKTLFGKYLNQHSEDGDNFLDGPTCRKRCLQIADHTMDRNCDAYGIIYEIITTAHNSSFYGSNLIGKATSLYDLWSQISSYEMLTEYPHTIEESLDFIDPAELKALKRKYKVSAIKDAYRLFNEIHKTYEQTLSVAKDMHSLESVPMKHSLIPYLLARGFTATLARDKECVRIYPSEMFLFAMAQHESERELQIKIMEVQKMASGADDKIWFEVTGANNTIASAISKLHNLKHYVVQTKNKGQFFWMIPNDESHFVNGFVSDKNLHYKRLGVDGETDVDTDHVSAICGKYFTFEIINAHQGQCNSCKTIKKNEESARVAEIEKKAREFDKQAELITRKVKTNQTLSAEEQVIAKELGIDRDTAMAITDASKQPFTNRNSQALDGQPRSSHPVNPKVNSKGKMITTSQIHSTAPLTTLEAGTTKMENGVKVIVEPKAVRGPAVESLNIEDQQLKAIEDEIGRLVFDKRDLEDKIKVVDARTVELMESWEKLDAYIKNQQVEIVISDETKDALDKAEKALEEARALAEKEKEEQEQRHASDLEDLRKMLTSLQT
tara:strand:- start:1529 stop:4111 length:2583 start_codon:yes stop_codon:yes gene_type:complete